MLQEREPEARVLRKDDRGERVPRRGQPMAERIGDHGNVVAAGIHVRQHKQDTSVQRRYVAGQDDSAHARARTDVPFPRQLLDDTARDAECQPGRLGQLLDRRNRFARLEAPVSDLVLDEGAQRVRKGHNPVRHVMKPL